jgi:hypothetical protein
VDLIPDANGAESETLAAAEQEAVRTAADIGLHELHGDPCQAVVETSDEHHHSVAITTVSIRINRPTSIPRTPSPWSA